MIFKLKAARASLGLTQAEVAKVVGVTKDCLSRWERGRFPPTLPDVIRWAEALGLAISLIPVGGA